MSNIHHNNEDKRINLDEWYQVDIGYGPINNWPTDPYGLIVEDVDCVYFEDERDALMFRLSHVKEPPVNNATKNFLDQLKVSALLDHYTHEFYNARKR